MTTYIHNRKASHNFEFLKEFEAGIVLSGYEVKAVRSGRANLTGAYVLIRGGEAFLVGASISPYQVANTPKEYDPEQARKLLLSKKELAELEQKSEKQGLTIVPIKLYNKNRHLKLAIVLARGKKKVDKRESMKARDVKRDIDRTLKMQ